MADLIAKDVGLLSEVVGRVERRPVLEALRQPLALHVGIGPQPVLPICAGNAQQVRGWVGVRESWSRSAWTAGWARTGVLRPPRIVHGLDVRGRRPAQPDGVDDPRNDPAFWLPIGIYQRREVKVPAQHVIELVSHPLLSTRPGLDHRRVGSALFATYLELAACKKALSRSGWSQHPHRNRLLPPRSPLTNAQPDPSHCNGQACE